MTKKPEQIVFDSKMGWCFESLTFHPNRKADILFHDTKNRHLYLELCGIRSPQALLAVLDGFDDFHVIQRDLDTPLAEYGKYLCRFYCDDDRYETIIDEYETYESKAEQPAAPLPLDPQTGPSDGAR